MELMYTGILAQSRSGGPTNIIAQLVQISEQKTPPPLEGFTQPILADPSADLNVPLLPMSHPPQAEPLTTSQGERSPPAPGNTGADSLSPFVPQMPWELAGLDKPTDGKKYIWFLSNPMIRVLLNEGDPLPKGFSLYPPKEVCIQPVHTEDSEVTDE